VGHVHLRLAEVRLSKLLLELALVTGIALRAFFLRLGQLGFELLDSDLFLPGLAHTEVEQLLDVEKVSFWTAGLDQERNLMVIVRRLRGVITRLARSCDVEMLDLRRCLQRRQVCVRSWLSLDRLGYVHDFNRLAVLTSFIDRAREQVRYLSLLPVF